MPGTFVDKSGNSHTLRSQENVLLYDGERIPIMANLGPILKDWTKAAMTHFKDDANPKDAVAFSHIYFKALALQSRQKPPGDGSE
jgi:hypothetical protein